MARKVSSSIKLAYKVLSSNEKNFVINETKRWNDFSFGNYTIFANYKDYEVAKAAADLYQIQLNQYFGISFRVDKNECQIKIRSIGTRMHYTYIDLNITSRDEFFNYMMCNDVGTLIFEDIAVLNEIKNLTLKILKGTY